MDKFANEDEYHKNTEEHEIVRSLGGKDLLENKDRKVAK